MQDFALLTEIVVLGGIISKPLSKLTRFRGQWDDSYQAELQKPECVQIQVKHGADAIDR
jgi:hypothetical protein